MTEQMSVFNGIFDVNLVKKDALNSLNSEFDKLLQNVNDLNLSVRSFNSIDKAGIKFVAELALMNENELKNLKNLGKKSFDEIKSVMEEIGYPVGCNFSSEDAAVLSKKINELKSE